MMYGGANMMPMGGMPPSYGMMGMAVQPGMGPMGGPAVVGAAGKSVKLPDGSIIEKSATKIAFRGPSGSTMEMKPIPTWQGSALMHASAGPAIEPVKKQGWLVKLSHAKGAFGSERWQKRWVVLSEGSMSYYANEQATQAKRTIPFVVGGAAMLVNAGDQRRKDAFRAKDSAPGITKALTASVGELASPYDGTMSRKCLAVHKPMDVANTMSAVMGANVMSLGFGAGRQALEDQRSRTWYFATEGDENIEEWVAATQQNFKALTTGGAGAKKVMGDFQQYLQRVGGTAEGVDLGNILDQLYDLAPSSMAAQQQAILATMPVVTPMMGGAAVGVGMGGGGMGMSVGMTATPSQSVGPYGGASCDEYAKACALLSANSDQAAMLAAMGWSEEDWKRIDAAWKDEMSRNLSIATAFGMAFMQQGGKIPTETPDFGDPNSREPVHGVDLDTYARMMAKMDKYGPPAKATILEELKLEEAQWGFVMGSWGTRQQHSDALRMQVVALKQSHMPNI